MKVWIIRGRYDAEALAELHKSYPQHDKGFKDGQYLYWTRDSRFTDPKTASIQTNHGSAKRALKRAKAFMEGRMEYVVDIELVEADLILPNGD